MTKPPKTPPPSRLRLLIAALLLVVGVFFALKAILDYSANGVWSPAYVSLSLLTLLLGGTTLRRLNHN